MSSYYELTPEERDERGLDPDLSSALQHNPQGTWDFDMVRRVHAVVPGDNEGPDWHWIIQLYDGRFLYATGGCDYTGWDCQSQLTSSFADTIEGALDISPEVEQSYSRGDRNIRSELARQVADTKRKTWREEKAAEFGV